MRDARTRRIDSTSPYGRNTSPTYRAQGRPRGRRWVRRGGERGTGRTQEGGSRRARPGWARSRPHPGGAPHLLLRRLVRQIADVQVAVCWCRRMARAPPLCGGFGVVQGRQRSRATKVTPSRGSGRCPRLAFALWKTTPLFLARAASSGAGLGGRQVRRTTSSHPPTPLPDGPMVPARTLDYVVYNPCFPRSVTHPAGPGPGVDVATGLAIQGLGTADTAPDTVKRL
jgi:hypothetical protein